mmetsp:Transcript_11060/g.45930  ORF Transcript_11060/g.45930 Transcript_11060/m.45930 type:complete len:687 (+) Transcript_11060:69-2129(+)
MRRSRSSTPQVRWPRRTITRSSRRSSSRRSSRRSSTRPCSSRRRRRAAAGARERGPARVERAVPRQGGRGGADLRGSAGGRRRARADRLRTDGAGSRARAARELAARLRRVEGGHAGDARGLLAGDERQDHGARHGRRPRRGALQAPAGDAAARGAPAERAGLRRAARPRAGGGNRRALLPPRDGAQAGRQLLQQHPARDAPVSEGPHARGRAALRGSHQERAHGHGRPAHLEQRQRARGLRGAPAGGLLKSHVEEPPPARAPRARARQGGRAHVGRPRARPRPLEGGHQGPAPVLRQDRAQHGAEPKRHARVAHALGLPAVQGLAVPVPGGPRVPQRAHAADRGAHGLQAPPPAVRPAARADARGALQVRQAVPGHPRLLQGRLGGDLLPAHDRGLRRCHRPRARALGDALHAPAGRAQAPAGLGGAGHRRRHGGLRRRARGHRAGVRRQLQVAARAPARERARAREPQGGLLPGLPGARQVGHRRADQGGPRSAPGLAAPQGAGRQGADRRVDAQGAPDARGERRQPRGDRRGARRGAGARAEHPHDGHAQAPLRGKEQAAAPLRRRRRQGGQRAPRRLERPEQRLGQLPPAARAAWRAARGAKGPAQVADRARAARVRAAVRVLPRALAAAEAAGRARGRRVGDALQDRRLRGRARGSRRGCRAAVVQLRRVRSRPARLHDAR